MSAPAPQLPDLITRPRSFFEALRSLPPRNGRYLWLVLLTGLVTGLYAALSQRPLQDALSTLPGLPGGSSFALVTGVVGGVLSSLVMWLLLWGLGSLGAGREGRAGEVFGASFVPSLVISLILLPLAALFPLQVNVAPPNFSGLEGAELSAAIQRYSAELQRDLGRQPLSILGNVLTYAALAWQFYLAWLGFGVLTGDRARALRGTLIPLAVLGVLALALWLLGRALQGAVGGGA